MSQLRGGAARCLLCGLRAAPARPRPVFSLHLHSFAFLVILVGVAIDTAAGVEQGQGWGNAGACTAILVYTFMALRRVYGQGRLWTALNISLLLLGYLVSLIATMILTLVITVMTI